MQLIDNIRTALTGIPRAQDWAEATLMLAGLILLAGMLGPAAGLVSLSPVEWAPDMFVIALIAIISPALTEELMFRVLLAGRRGVWRAGVALTLFVLWHPAQFWLGLPTAQPTFTDPAFLAITAALGLACTISYRRSGSIWPTVATHWAVVVMWKGLAGG